MELVSKPGSPPISRQNGVKLAASISFILLTLALVLVAANSPAHGYELSLYSSLPAATWVCLVAAMIIGTGIIVDEALSSNRSWNWYLGFLIITLANVIILSLPIVRGYYLVALTDPFQQVYAVGDVLATGVIRGENYYPVTTLIGAPLSALGSISPSTAANMVPVIFTILSSVFVYLLATQVSCNRTHALLAAAAGTTLLYSYYHVSPYPQAVSLFLFPLAFYLYFKVLRTRTLAFEASFIILVLLLPFTHPSTEVVFIFCLAGVGVLLWALKGRGTDLSAKILSRSTLNLAFVSSLLFFAWLSAFSIFANATFRFIRWLTGNIAEVPRSSEFAAVAAIDPLERVLTISKLYGAQFVFLVLAAFALVIIARRYVKSREVNCLFVLAAFVLISGPVYLLLFMGIGLITLGRFVGANTILWALPVLAAFSLSKLAEARRLTRPLAVGIITLVLISASTLGVFAVYRSSWIDQPNTQVTQMQYDGGTWSATYALDTANFGYLGTPAGYHYVSIPAHFGYPDNSTLGDTLQTDYPSGVLVLLTQEFRLAVKDPILSAGSLSPAGLSAQGFTSEDLARLGRDTSVNKVYGNGEFDIFQVV